jgi:hypothetical protein
MAHFAKLNNKNIVEQVIVIDNNDIQNLEFPDSEPIGQQFIQSLGLEETWIQTSYNGNFRKNYAGIGFVYDNDLDAFIPPQPYPSWVLDTTRGIWEPPIPYPVNDNDYVWDEQLQQWVNI